MKMHNMPVYHSPDEPPPGFDPAVTEELAALRAQADLPEEEPEAAEPPVEEPEAPEQEDAPEDTPEEPEQIDFATASLDDILKARPDLATALRPETPEVPKEPAAPTIPEDADAQFSAYLEGKYTAAYNAAVDETYENPIAGERKKRAILDEISREEAAYAWGKNAQTNYGQNVTALVAELSEDDPEVTKALKARLGRIDPLTTARIKEDEDMKDDLITLARKDVTKAKGTPEAGPRTSAPGQNARGNGAKPPVRLSADEEHLVGTTLRANSSLTRHQAIQEVRELRAGRN